MSSYMLIIYVVAFIAIFYFMAIRPQQRQRRAHAELLNSLKKGDTIVTAAGMYGTVKKVDENVVEVEIAKGVTIKISRRAVSEIIRDRAQARAVAPSRRAKAAPKEIEEAVEEPVDEPVDEEVDEPVDEDVDDYDYSSEDSDETAEEDEEQNS